MDEQRIWSRRDPEQQIIIDKLAKKYGIPKTVVISIISYYFVAFKNYLLLGHKVSIPGLFVYSLHYETIKRLRCKKRKKKKKSLNNRASK